MTEILESSIHNYPYHQKASPTFYHQYSWRALGRINWQTDWITEFSAIQIFTQIWEKHGVTEAAWSPCFPGCMCRGLSWASQAFWGGGQTGLQLCWRLQALSHHWRVEKSAKLTVQQLITVITIKILLFWDAHGRGGPETQSLSHLGLSMPASY